MIYDDHAAYLVSVHDADLEEIRDMLIDGSPLLKKHRSFLSHLLIELIRDKEQNAMPKKNGRPQVLCSNDLAIHNFWQACKLEKLTKVQAHARYGQERRAISFEAFTRSITRGAAAARRGENLALAYRFGVE